MKIRPLHDRVVIRRVEGEQQTASGLLYIPDTAQEGKRARGEVVVAGLQQDER